MSDQQRFSIGSVKAAKPGSKYLATLDFVAHIAAFERVTATRDWQDDKKEWQKQYVAEADGPFKLTVKHAFLKERRDGGVFIQVQGVMLPKCLGEEVAKAANDLLFGNPEADAPAAAGAKKGGSK